MYLTEGINDFVYVGATMTADRVFAAISGTFDVVYISPPGGGDVLTYRPNADAPLVPAGSAVRIGMKRGAGVRFTMNP